ncbi:unnamed protein product [Rotaria sp. Silwood2]|nr:unnamed protein product [Rotaria sp. Silwood2]
MAQSTSIQLVWLDANIHRDINREFWTKIREIYPEAMKFDDQDECLRFLGSGCLIYNGAKISCPFMFIVQTYPSMRGGQGNMKKSPSLLQLKKC